MKRSKLFKSLTIGLFGLSFFLTTGLGRALPGNAPAAGAQGPIVIIIVDKLDSIKLYSSNLPSIRRFLKMSACGLMNIRSGSGYADSGAGYLSLGAGSRATSAGLPGGAFEAGQLLTGGRAGSFLNWSLGIPLTARSDQSMIVPEIGWLINQARLEDHPVIPGRLGTFFQNRGWRTCLIGNVDEPDQKNRPGGLFLMNRQGLIDEGNIDQSLNERDPGFPYLYRTNIPKLASELNRRLAQRKIIAVDFGDFARLDLFRNQMRPAAYARAEKNTWDHLNLLLSKIMNLCPGKSFPVLLLSPSISQEGMTSKNQLAPLAIYSKEYPPGLLTSGTTRWTGLVANIDLLPTLASMADLGNFTSFGGKIMKYVPTPDNTPKILLLNERLAMINANLRPMINWYQGIISFGWILGWLGVLFLKRRKISDWLFNTVAVIPLSLIILPILPYQAWQVPVFLALTVILSLIISLVQSKDTRILILSGVIWSVLIVDQMLGWRLIRFSALGYNAVNGSRYYGLGNEYLGVFLAAALLFAELLHRKISVKWPVPVILGLSIFILSWPQFGAKFGGILAGAAGFAYYTVRLFNWKLKNYKLWFSLLSCCIMLALIGWWDSMRPPEIQTHIGRFLHLLFSKDFGQVGEIIIRKLMMNLRLTVFSPWIRIILLTLILGVLNRLLCVRPMIKAEDAMVWQAVMIAGITAYLINDAGVLAFATCLSYAFSFVLLKNEGTMRRKAKGILTLANRGSVKRVP